MDRKGLMETHGECKALKVPLQVRPTSEWALLRSRNWERLGEKESKPKPELSPHLYIFIVVVWFPNV